MSRIVRSLSIYLRVMGRLPFYYAMLCIHMVSVSEFFFLRYLGKLPPDHKNKDFS